MQTRYNALKRVDVSSHPYVKKYLDMKAVSKDQVLLKVLADYGVQIEL